MGWLKVVHVAIGGIQKAITIMLLILAYLAALRVNDMLRAVQMRL